MLFDTKKFPLFFSLSSTHWVNARPSAMSSLTKQEEKLKKKNGLSFFFLLFANLGTKNKCMESRQNETLFIFSNIFFSKSRSNKIFINDNNKLRLRPRVLTDVRGADITTEVKK